MTSPRITFIYSSASTLDPWWVRLEQENLPDDTATLSDAAELLDTLFDLDPCETEEKEEEPEDPEEEKLEETVDETVERGACLYDADGNVDVTLRVIRSHLTVPYKLRLQGGDLLTTETVRENITREIVIENASDHTLDYPVISGFSASWRGRVYGNQGMIDGPAIARTGNTLVFDAEIKSASLTATYLTEYDVCTVTILGVEGEPGECTARVFFHGLVDELELEIPEASEPLDACIRRWVAGPLDYDIECYREVTISTRCQCSDHEVASRTYDETVDCPESVIRCLGVETECRHLVGSVTIPEYVECTDDNEITGMPGMIYSLSTPEYYEEHCCKKPGFPLPQCPEKTITHRGGMKLQGGARQYRNIYGPLLRITPISPPGGVCGNWRIRQSVVPSGCCDGVPPLAWDSSVSPEVMAPNSAAIVGVTGGGRYDYEWTVEGEGFQFQATGSKRVLTADNPVYLSALPTACGTAIITVTDGCSATVGAVKSTNGEWTGGCRRIFVIEGGLRDGIRVYRTTMRVSSDGCYGEKVAGPFGWDNPSRLPYRSVEHWLQIWNGSTWGPVAGAIWYGDVLDTEWQALLAAVDLPVVRVNDTYTPPDGAGGAYGCGEFECVWRCVG